MMSTEQKLLSKYGGVDTNTLDHVFNIGNNEDDEAYMNNITSDKHSSYVNSDEFVSFCLERRNKYNIFSLNIQSIRA